MLITITLLAFLVLLLVSLASLTRVETQVASNSQQLTQARQNALLALNIAMGQLQKYTGPDQRVTARADILSTAPAAGNAMWTGVWGNTQPSSGLSTAPTLLNWLVSGNESASFTPGTAAANFGQITTTASGITNAPATALTTTGATPTGVILVGTNSVGSATADQVIAPLKNITTPAKQLPGFASTDNTDTPVGRYAYWVGDEGVKARVNLIDPGSSTSTVHPLIQSWATAQRTGIEQVYADTTTPIGSAYPVNAANLKSVLALSQLPLAATTSADQTALSSAAVNRFHDLTTVSRSVLADAASGGLKKDLTNWFAGTSGTLPSGAPADTDSIFSPADVGLASATAADAFGLPKWGLIRSFNATRYDGTNALAPRLPSDTVQGISPVMTYVNLGIGITGAPGGALAVRLFPMVVLWNPYSAPLRADTYEVGISMAGFVSTSQGRGIIFKDAADSSVLAILNLARCVVENPPSGAPTNTTPAATKYFRFRIQTGQLAAGASQVFSLATDGATYDATNQMIPGTVQNSVILPSSITIPATTTKINWVSSASGGGFEVILRNVNAATEQLGFNADPDDYQQIQNVGYGGSLIASPAPSTDLPTGPLPTPQTNMAVEANMANQLTGLRYYNRWIVQQNLRAPLSTRSQFEYSGGGNANSSYFNGSNTGLPVFAGNNASAGVQVGSPSGTATSLVLAEILPDPAGAGNLPIMSLGQLQHANLSLLDIYPPNPVGNAHPNYRLSGTQVTRPTTDASATLTGHPVNQLIKQIYDLSYGLNRTLWDRYFFSTVPSTLTQANVDDTSYQLPNTRLTFYRDAPLTLNDVAKPDPAFDTAAAHLLLEGGFNINSTSLDAWRAVLSSFNNLPYNPVTQGAGSALSFPLSRFVAPQAGANDPWQGYRTLTAAQINQLAADIVAQVKLRGPFLSLADFVNRRLATDSTGLKGTLQAALDTTTTGAGAVNAASTAPFTAANGYAKLYSGVTAGNYYLDQMRGATSDVAPYATQTAFAPGMLSQADLLSQLGATLTARSDTFKIRTYGEVINPVTGVSEGKAWCEAVVQRYPDYLNPADPAQTVPASLSATQNKDFGRRFGIVSFRWLTPQDI